ncbi:Mur ligase domain-containing protein, partial [Streptomyces sp. NPDC001389]|uniref:Mur ligase domain-containing protein n=1 Tax=Streptomyces sp. NPDC001389 TaxID=3364569 RepID=UPI0036802868
MCETRCVEVPPPAGPLDLTRPHFVGICGAGMSALAHLLADRGARVSGSDVQPGGTAASLEAAGCRVQAGHEVGNWSDPRNSDTWTLDVSSSRGSDPRWQSGRTTPKSSSGTR